MSYDEMTPLERLRRDVAAGDDLCHPDLLCSGTEEYDLALLRRAYLLGRVSTDELEARTAEILAAHRSATLAE